MRLLKYTRLSCIVLFATSFAQESPACPAIIQYVEENLPLYGTLRRSGGFVYVDIDDAYIHQLISFIQQDEFEEPPYFGGTTLGGAHITVINSVESAKYGIQEIAECGEVIAFVPQRCQVVHPPRWKEIEKAYLLVVDAPQLDMIREKYGLPMREYDFHITIGVKPNVTKKSS